ncbi:unnamed protein product [Nippostrongylus brasiliensis]|uniref:MFS domain-containing protein n=1 Tax=Nippostrongylus brasiliensis TaxID=27835 RepID=A0A158QYG9_NIPBR|nr:unnamed protein product [Nippostrongylus brasiliensis]
MIGLFNSTYMNVNLAITMTCMINSTAISLLERSPIDNYTDNFDNVTELIEHVQAAEGAMNAIIPYLAVNYGVWPVFGARFVLGIGEAFIYPCINTIVSNWFPIEERSTAVALFTTGNQVALFLGNPIAARLCDSRFGWPAVYYFSDDCRVMKMEERQFLKKSALVVKKDTGTKSPAIPWSKIFSNRAFVAHLISTWILTTVVTVMMVYLPTYFKDVMLLSVIMNGIYTSLPMLCNFTFKLSWGVFIDKLKGKRVLTQTQAVKISQCFPTFGVALGLVPIALFATCQRPVLTLLLFCFTNMCLGAHTSGAYTSLLSLAPRFTPTLSSISVSCSMLAQLTTPFMVAAVKSRVR